MHFCQVHGSKAAAASHDSGEGIAVHGISGRCELAPGPVDDEGQEAVMTEFVMAYFNQHPLAMDTVEGIVEWWMPDMIRPDQTAMRKVLDRLTERGILERIGAGEYAHYRLKNG